MTDLNTAAIKQALDALEETVHWRTTGIGRPPEQTAMDAIAALREALAEHPAQQEPAAWRLWDEDPLGGTDHRWAYYDKSDFANGVDPTKHFKVEPLYTSPQPAQQEPDDSLLLCASDLEHSAIYDNSSEMQSCIRAVASRIKALAVPQPAQRTWVGLSDEEIEDIHCTPPRARPRGKFPFARIIEAKLKEKNT